MEVKRRSAGDRRFVSSVATRNFRKLFYGALGIVLSSYVVLFILVVSRHLDQNAVSELRRAASLSSSSSSSSSSSAGDSKDPAAAVVAIRDLARPPKFVGGIGPSLLGMERFHDRWAAVARVLAANEPAPSHPRRRVHVCLQPRFRNPPGPLVALASFPGSGNTWVRFLVQQATGVLTGSVYRDYSLKRNGFPAENVANGSVLLIKTHEWGDNTRKKFQKAVLLIRDPYGALLAEFNRRAGGHVGHASPEKFHRGNAWKTFALTHSKVWMESVLDWLQYDGPLLVLRYEVMIADLPNQLIRLLRFLNATVTWPTFQCVIRNRDGIFRRAKKQLSFNPFDESLQRVVEGYKSIVERALQLQEQGIKFDIHNVTTVGGGGDGSSDHNRTLGGVTYVEKEQSDAS